MFRILICHDMVFLDPQDLVVYRSFSLDDMDGLALCG